MKISNNIHANIKQPIQRGLKAAVLGMALLSVATVAGASVKDTFEISKKSESASNSGNKLSNFMNKMTVPFKTDKPTNTLDFNKYLADFVSGIRITHGDAAKLIKSTNNYDIYDLDVKSEYPDNPSVARVIAGELKTRQDIPPMYRIDFKQTTFINPQTGAPVKINTRRFQGGANTLDEHIAMWDADGYKYTQMSLLNKETKYELRMIFQEDMFENLVRRYFIIDSSDKTPNEVDKKTFFQSFSAQLGSYDFLYNGI